MNKPAKIGFVMIGLLIVSSLVMLQQFSTKSNSIVEKTNLSSERSTINLPKSANAWDYLRNNISSTQIMITQNYPGSLDFQWRIAWWLASNSLGGGSSVYGSNAYVQLNQVQNLDLCNKPAESTNITNATSFYPMNSGPVFVDLMNGTGFSSIFDSYEILYSNYNQILIDSPPIWVNSTMGILYAMNGSSGESLLADTSLYDCNQYSASTPSFIFSVANDSNAQIVNSSYYFNTPAFISYALKPIFILNSSYNYNDINMYVYTPCIFNPIFSIRQFAWQQIVDPSNIILTNPFYKIRITSKISGDILFEDTTMQNFTISRVISIASNKYSFVNCYAQDPLVILIFHNGQFTTSFALGPIDPVDKLIPTNSSYAAIYLNGTVQTNVTQFASQKNYTINFGFKSYTGIPMPILPSTTTPLTNGDWFLIILGIIFVLGIICACCLRQKGY